MTGFIVLHGQRSSVVIETRPDEAPLWRYWGPRLADRALPEGPVREARPAVPSSLDVDLPLTLAPGFGAGWYAQSALLAHRGGRDFTQHVSACQTLWHEPGRCVEFQLHDPVARLRLCITLRLHAEHDALAIHSTLTNLAEADTPPLDLQWLAAATLPLPGHCDAVHSYAGQWANEFAPQTDRLSASLWQRQNRRGRTSHDCFPGAVVSAPGCTRQAGSAWGAHLAWSGNHAQCVEWLADGRYQWQLGEWLAPGELRLAPGESLTTPTVFAAFSDQGQDGLAAAFHGLLRGQVRWPGGRMRPRPVHLNTWEAVYFNHREADLMALADAGAALGVERFVLDDGWFHGRSSDRAGLGDWWPDAAKYPAGLAPLAAHVRALGMEFGLWVEPEMVNPASDLYRAHPDWVLQVDGRPRLTHRHQLVLDLARPEVANHLFDSLDALLRGNPIAYLKWDMNRDLTTAGGVAGGAAYRSQTLALYALLARVRAAHPALEIESCASGGARIDAGVLRHTHRVWTSDCNDALSRVAIQRGCLQFFPPELLGAHIGPVPAHTTGRSQPLDFRAAVALPLHLGLELDVRQLAAAERDRLAAWIALYKALRPQLHGGRVWQGEAGDGIVWQAHGDADDDVNGSAAGITRLLLFVYRLQPTRFKHSPALRLPMLAGTAQVYARRIDPPPAADDNGSRHPADSAPFFDRLAGAGTLLAGSWLAHAGLPLPRMQAESALIVQFERRHDTAPT